MRYLPIVTLLLVAGCRMDWPYRPIEECDNLEGVPIYPDPWYSRDLYVDPWYMNPLFNPNNPHELLLSRTINQPLSLYGIHKLNLLTGELTPELFQLKTPYKMSWSVSDWIAFGGMYPYHMYRVKSNGDSLTAMATLGSSFHPDWSNDGKLLLMFTDRDPSTGTGRRVIVVDFLGTDLDTLVGMLPVAKWGPGDSTIAFKPSTGTRAGLGLHQYPNTDSLRYVHAGIDWEAVSLYSSAFSPVAPLFFWTGGVGGQSSIHCTDFESGISYLVKQGCKNRRYLVTDVSPDGQWLATNRTEFTPDYENNRYIVKNRIVLMRIDGSDEHVVWPLE